MSPEGWALVGVIVGAVLGGLAQLVSDGLRRRHERDATTRDARRPVYTDWIRRLHQFDMATYAALAEAGEAFGSLEESTWGRRRVIQLHDWAQQLPDEPDRKTLARLALGMFWLRNWQRYRKVLEGLPTWTASWSPSVQALNTRVERFQEMGFSLAAEQASLRLVAPDDTYAAGLAARDSLWGMVDVDPEVDGWQEALEIARDAFYPLRDEFVRLAKRDLGIN